MLMVVLCLASLLVFSLYLAHCARRELQFERYFTDVLLGSDALYSRAVAQMGHGRVDALAKLSAARVVARLGVLIYRIDENTLREFSRAMNLDRYLINRALHTNGSSRIEALRLLSQVPLACSVEQELSPLLENGDREAAFWAMLAIINGDREHVIEYLASYKYIMSVLEVSQVLEMLGRGVVSVAYQPLLIAESMNLNLIGLALVERFGVESASQMVASLAQDSPWSQVRARAVEVLISMQLPIAIDVIARYIYSLRECERYSLLRHLAFAGYSSSSLMGIITSEERRYFLSLVQSYKVKIEC